MSEMNQGSLPPEPPEFPPTNAAPSEPALPQSDPALEMGRSGLRSWLIVLGLAGIPSVLFGQFEFASMVVLAGILVTAQAADLNERWIGIYRAVAWIVPVGGVVLFAGTAASLNGSVEGGTRMLALASTALGAAVVLGWTPTAAADALARTLFRVPVSTHVMRLTARLVVILLAFAFPGWLAFRALQERWSQLEPILGPGELLSSLFGLLLVSLAGVGFMLKRDGRATLDRLGLHRPKLLDVLIIVGGVAAIAGF